MYSVAVASIGYGMGQVCHVLSIGEFVESDIARASRKNWPRWKRIVISCVREAHGKGLYTVVMVDRGKRTRWYGVVGGDLFCMCYHWLAVARLLSLAFLSLQSLVTCLL